MGNKNTNQTAPYRKRLVLREGEILGIDNELSHLLAALVLITSSGPCSENFVVIGKRAWEYPLGMMSFDRSNPKTDRSGRS